jgi:ABC-type sulfate transport system substrate-binding protein
MFLFLAIQGITTGHQRLTRSKRIITFENVVKGTQVFVDVVVLERGETLICAGWDYALLGMATPTSTRKGGIVRKRNTKKGREKMFHRRDRSEDEEEIV